MNVNPFVGNPCNGADLIRVMRDVNWFQGLTRTSTPTIDIGQVPGDTPEGTATLYKYCGLVNPVTGNMVRITVASSDTAAHWWERREEFNASGMVVDSGWFEAGDTATAGARPATGYRMITGVRQCNHDGLIVSLVGIYRRVGASGAGDYLNDWVDWQVEDGAGGTLSAQISTHVNSSYASGVSLSLPRSADFARQLVFQEQDPWLLVCGSNSITRNQGGLIMEIGGAVADIHGAVYCPWLFNQQATYTEDLTQTSLVDAPRIVDIVGHYALCATAWNGLQLCGTGSVSLAVFTAGSTPVMVMARVDTDTTAPRFFLLPSGDVFLHNSLFYGVFDKLIKPTPENSFQTEFRRYISPTERVSLGSPDGGISVPPLDGMNRDGLYNRQIEDVQDAVETISTWVYNGPPPPAIPAGIFGAALDFQPHNEDTPHSYGRTAQEAFTRDDRARVGITMHHLQNTPPMDVDIGEPYEIMRFLRWWLRCVEFAS